ncbi:UNVERIFIED_CONTAM: hypothetical protein Sindi_2653200 [Sesamum indicum]
MGSSPPATTLVLPVDDAVADVDMEMGDAAADLVEYTNDVINEVSPDDVIHDVSLDDVIHDVSPDDVIHDVSPDDVIHDVSPDVVRCDVINGVKNCRSFPKQSSPIPTGLFVGNIPRHSSPNAIDEDKIAHAFNKLSRKTLSFIAQTVQNGEIVVQPSLDTVRDGSKRWKTTAVGYFHHLKEYAQSVWPALREVTATTNGFFFFQFKTVIDMEEVIEGGPWLFQGQPIVLQKWEPGMAMRKLKHTQIPVWIKLRHLPMEYWTTEGLSTVASVVGKPLYPDAITRACTRLDFARVCVMLDVTQTLRKHIIIMTPNEDGGETPCKIDVEYEWLPPKCTSCITIGHMTKDCELNKPLKPSKTPPLKRIGRLRIPGPKVGWASLLSGSLKIPRHLFILWLAILGKLATTDKSWLAHLGPCILCNEGATETHGHLFFQCRFSRKCLTAIRRMVRYSWPNRDWIMDIEWASQKWRGKHIVNISYRALLASCVYHIWRERNLRRFEHTERTPSTMALLIVEDIKQRILSISLPRSVSTRALYRLWRIPWPASNIDSTGVGASRKAEDDKHKEHNADKHNDRGKAVVLYNAFDALHYLDDTDEPPRGPNTCNPTGRDPC